VRQPNLVKKIAPSVHHGIPVGPVVSLGLSGSTTRDLYHRKSAVGKLIEALVDATLNEYLTNWVFI
jgi:hypothetical protein